MNKLKTAEFILLGAVIFLFFALMVTGMANLFGPPSLLVDLLFILLVVAGIAFLVVYVIRCLKGKTKWIKAVQLICPVLMVIVTYVFADGMGGTYFAWINIASTIIGIGTFAMYNLFYYLYYGGSEIAILTWILYIVGSVYMSWTKLGVAYLHNYLLAFLPLALFGGYIENAVIGFAKRAAESRKK